MFKLTSDERNKNTVRRYSVIPIQLAELEKSSVFVSWGGCNKELGGLDNRNLLSYSFGS